MRFNFGKLKDEHRFWSYESDSVNDVPDDILISEDVLIRQPHPKGRGCRIIYFQKIIAILISCDYIYYHQFEC